MAPRKATTAVEASDRVTRSSTRRANSDATAEHPEAPEAKKAKTEREPSKTTKAKAKAKAKPKPKPEAESEEKKEVNEEKDEAGKEPKVLNGSKTVVIEHCKQCNSFKTRAIQVKNGLEKGLVGINVAVNPEKPRRGCFEIREEGGEIFISLLDMKRPFAPMKALDMEKVISDIIDKIN